MLADLQQLSSVVLRQFSSHSAAVPSQVLASFTQQWADRLPFDKLLIMVVVFGGATAQHGRGVTARW